MADLKVTALKRQRTLNKNKLIRSHEYAKALEETTTLEELNVRFEQVEKLHDTLNNIEAQIAEISETEEADPTIDEYYYEAAALLRSSIRNHSLREPQQNNALNFTTNASNIGHQSEVKLPKLYIPPFSGCYADWPSFFDMFCTTIHEANLSGVEKFQYLKGLLRGEAASLLKHIRVTESNYMGAFNKLKERYDNGKYIIHSHIKTFMEQPNVQCDNLTSLRKLRDVSDEVIRGLSALGNKAEARDPWIIYLLLKKVDEKTELAWANFSNENDHPSIAEFFKFMDKRISALETCSAPQKRIWLQMSNSQIQLVTVKVLVLLLNARCALCEKFHAMDAVKRKEFIQSSNRCYNCLSAKHPVSKCPSKRRCQQCGRKHHSLLHFEETKVQSHPAVNVETDTTVAHVSSICHTYSGVQIPKHTILPTALVGVFNRNGKIIYCRALLDSGSQVSFITEDCAQRLKLQRFNSRISVSGIGDMSVGATKGKIKLALKTNKMVYEINALVLRKITCSLPVYDISRANITLPKNVELADSEFHISREIDILIGADHFFSCLEPGQMKIPNSTLMLQETIFGWIVCGQMNEATSQEYVSMLAINDITKIIDIDQSLRRFWEVEEVTPLKPQFSEEEALCEKKFIATTRLDDDGRFVVQLPFKQSPKKLGGTLSVAIRRLQGVEKRFTRDPEFKRLYHEFMSEYQTLGHMVEITDNQTSKQPRFYLPHHGVLRMESTTTKLRVVFDGSAKSTTGISLNDCLAAGPVVQPSLFAILLRFREYPVAFSADAENMYRMVKLDAADTDYQRILWRRNVSESIKHFRLLTVTYGLTSASYLATRTLQEISDRYAGSHPEASSIIAKCFYVDDLMSGAQNIEEASQLIKSTCEILDKHGFKMRKWKANCPAALCGRDESLLDTSAKSFGEQDVGDCAVKVLGISWNPGKDKFTFEFKLNDVKTCYTKRGVLSAAGKLFDPMGWLSPATVMVKIFMQQLWCKRLDWDDQLSEELNRQWLSILSGLGQVGCIELPRHLETVKSSKVEIHGFCDASVKAYAAVVYYRFLNANQKIIVQMISSKTKVAPMKQQSLPRLELCGALLLAKLISSISREAGVQIVNCTYWTDSKIVLDWLQSYPRRWSTFVGNRTSEIKSLSKREQWRHVPSTSNPADCASRGMAPIDLASHDLWWRGPAWLYKEQHMWPVQSKTYNTTEEEEHIMFTFSAISENKWVGEFLCRYSSFQRAQRILCYIVRFINACRVSKAVDYTGKSLLREELAQVEVMLCKHEQEKFYAKELAALRVKSAVANDSQLKCLNPFLDKYGVLRVGGRLQHSLAPYANKHPIILHCKSRLSWLLLQDEHIYSKHAGPSLMMSLIKQRYWIPRGKSRAKSVVDKCVICSRFNAKLQQQLMGSLPKSRLDLVRPFLSTGIDYAGPFSIHLTKGRGQKVYKAYICIFICMCTKAIHLEVVSDLTSDAFLGALKRFVSRRGGCHNIFSDNGTNFVGANAKLSTTFNSFREQSRDINHFLSKNKMQWNFNPPNSPHFGGLWESGVKSFKFHFKRVMGKSMPTLEEMTTLIVEIGALLNKCPLCRDVDNELDYLTPSHFLHGYAPITIPSVDVAHLNSSIANRWRAINEMVRHFWNRWYNEYITSLQGRSKWQQEKKQIQVGDIVLIQDTGLPISHWLIGKVIEIHPGIDEKVRVVTLKTANGEIRRSIHRLCLLPIANQANNDDTNVQHDSRDVQEDAQLINQTDTSKNDEYPAMMIQSIEHSGSNGAVCMVSDKSEIIPST